MRVPVCRTCEGTGWVCEDDASKAWTADAEAPGMPCHCNPNGELPPGSLIICEHPDARDYSRN